MKLLPQPVTPTLACASCGARITVHVLCRPLRSAPGVLAMRVTTLPADQAWLKLFTASHRGPIVRA